MTSPADPVPHPDDRDLLVAVRRGFDWAPSLDPSHVAVGMRGDVITLSGEVSSASQVRRATAAALKVDGVSSVANAITVRVPWKSAVPASELAAAVGDAISATVDITRDRIQIEVTDESVTLRGEVDWNAQREQADSVARTIAGPHQVHDLLTVKHN